MPFAGWDSPSGAYVPLGPEFALNPRMQGRGLMPEMFQTPDLMMTDPSQMAMLTQGAGLGGMAGNMQQQMPGGLLAAIMQLFQGQQPPQPMLRPGPQGQTPGY